MAALQTDSKCSHITVYAALLTRFAPCPRTQSEVLKPLIGLTLSYTFFSKIQDDGCNRILKIRPSIIEDRASGDMPNLAG
jgi:hypothetical protein